MRRPALRCVDTMGLGILVVATLPAGAIGAWTASRIWRRLAPSRPAPGLGPPR